MRKAFSETVYQQLEDLEQISNEEKEQIENCFKMTKKYHFI